MNRFENALSIQEGACNPSGIARALVEACDEARTEGTQQANDPAVRLIVHQLAHLCNVDQINDICGVYHDLTERCRKGSV